MHGLRLESGDSLSDVLSQLRELRHLDVSEENPDGHPGDDFMMSSPDPMAKFRVNEFLQRRPPVLPRIVSLDLSGREDVAPEVLCGFLSARPSLRFLGLVFTEACKDEALLQLAGDEVRAPGGPTMLSGSGSESQVSSHF